MLENQPIPLDETIPTCGRKGKKPYEEVQYNQEYQPPEFNDPGFVNKQVKFNDTVNQPNIQREKVDKPSSPRRSERIRNKSKTRWRPTKVAHALLGTMANVFLVANCVYAEPAKPLLKSIPVKETYCFS